MYNSALWRPPKAAFEVARRSTLGFSARTSLRCMIHLGPVFPQQINLPTDDLIDELPVEKRHLSKLIIICRI